MKKIQYFFLMFLIFPMFVFAYSNEVILGGETIGIHIDTPGVMVIGFYKVNGSYQKGYPEIHVGDYITHINETEVETIEELTSEIEKNIKDGQVIVTLKRQENSFKTALNLEQIDGVYKTGLYVKDGITGIGTLSYIDPSTKIYGALGHEIVESTSSSIVEVKTGNIFESTVTAIRKSSNGLAGEKNANFNFNHIYGDIKENTNRGIFGVYQEELSKTYIPVGTKDDISLGNAQMYTVLKGQQKEPYDIDIIKIQEKNEVKNITFQITDERLLEKAGGIVQGMSGSPIVQNNKLIGAVTHVVVDNPITGYGIFITTMLEYGDKIKD